MFYKSQIFYEQELCFNWKEKFRIIYTCQKFTEYFFKVNIVVSDFFPIYVKYEILIYIFALKKAFIVTILIKNWVKQKYGRLFQIYVFLDIS